MKNKLQDNCQGQQVNNPETYEARRWQTPYPGKPGYTPSFQSFASLVGYPQVIYNNARTAASVNVLAFTKDPKVTLVYYFNGNKQVNNTYQVNSSFNGTLNIVVQGSDGSKLEMEEVFFIWNNPTVSQGPQYLGGQKGTIVEMFGWPYADIAKECPSLGQMGYMGVKIFPPQESVLSWDQPQSNLLNPWYWIYQPGLFLHFTIFEKGQKSLIHFFFFAFFQFLTAWKDVQEHSNNYAT